MKKEKCISFKVSEEEYKAIQIMRKNRMMTLSQFIRFCVVDGHLKENLLPIQKRFGA